MTDSESRRWGQGSVFFFVLTFIMFIPVLGHPESILLMRHEYARILLPEGDPYMFFWNLWWIRGWLDGAHPLLKTNMLYYPFGANLGHHTLSFTNGLWAYLLPAACPYPLQLNLLIFLHTFLTASGVYFIARKLRVSVPAALTAGVIALAWPARLSHISHHLNVVSTAWIPFFLLLVISGSSKNILKTAGAGICLAMLGASGWHLFISLLLVSWIILFGETNPLPALLKRWIPSVIIALICLSPLLWSLYHDLTPLESRQENERIRYSLKPVDLVKPVWLPMVKGKPVSFDSARIEQCGYMGLLPGALFLIGMLKGKRRERLWLSAAGILIILSFGPAIGGMKALPAPYRLLSLLPGFGQDRTPGRMMVTAGIFLAIGIALVLNRSDRFNRNRWIPVSVILILLADLFPFIPGSKVVPVHRVFQTLPIASPAFPAILNLPRDWTIRRYQFEQTYHGHPITSGFVARLDPDYFRRTDAVPLMARFSKPEKAADALLDARNDELFDVISLYHIQSIIIHRNLCRGISAETWRRLTRKFETLLMYADNRIMVIRAGGSFPSPTTHRCRFYYWDNWFSEENWDTVHSSVRWSAGREATLKLFIPEHARRVHFSFWAHLPVRDNGPTPSVSVYWNGAAVLTARISLKKRWSRIEGFLEPPFPSKGGSLVLRFDRSWVPAEVLPSSEDTRCLGGAVDHFSLSIVE